MVYSSRSNRLRVVMPLSMPGGSTAVGDGDGPTTVTGTLTGHYVLYFEASGCADLPVPEHAWLQRKGDTLQVACNHTAERWHLVCKGNDWVGAFGNCSAAPALHGRTGQGGTSGGGGSRNGLPGQTAVEEAHGVHLQQFPFGLLVAIAIGAVVGIVVGCIFLLTVFTFRKRFNQHAPDRRGVLTTADYDNSALGGTVLMHDHDQHLQTTIYASTGGGCREINAYKTASELRGGGGMGHHLGSVPEMMTPNDFGAPPMSGLHHLLYSTGVGNAGVGSYPRGGWDLPATSGSGECPSCGCGDSGCGVDGNGDDCAAGRCGCGREISPAAADMQPPLGSSAVDGGGSADSAEQVCFTEELVRRKLLFGRCLPAQQLNPALGIGVDESPYGSTATTANSAGGSNGPKRYQQLGGGGGSDLVMRTFKGGQPSQRQPTTTNTGTGGGGGGTGVGILR
jgi:hypothetical protein